MGLKSWITRNYACVFQGEYPFAIKGAFFLCLLISAFFTPFSLFSNPKEGKISHGKAEIFQENSHLTIQQNSQKAIIDWAEFSIGKHEVTQFIQPDDQSVVLNRVTGIGPSHIDGLLQANGHVYLTNPQGLIVGKTGSISTKGFLATTLMIKTEEFLNGSSLLMSGSFDRGILNRGSITAEGGDVVLIAREVKNTGTIQANGGSAVLVGGREVLLAKEGEKATIRMPTEGHVCNEGLIKAAQVELKAAGGNVYSTAVNHEGVIAATGVKGVIAATGVKRENGRIILKNELGKMLVSGELSAKSHEDNGGIIHILGEKIELSSSARVDVSGKKTGGELLAGGDYQGKNRDITNAKELFVAKGVKVLAHATEEGSGGKAIFWADDAIDFNGNVNAEGFGKDQKGGFVEVSSKGFWAFDGMVTTLCEGGETGLLLFDPSNITVTTAATTGGAFDGGSPTNTFVPSAATANVNNTTLSTLLDSSNVKIDSTAGPGAATTGTISISDPVSWSANTTFFIEANRDVNITTSITSNYAGASPNTAMDFRQTAIPATGNWDGFNINGATLSTVNGDIIIVGQASSNGTSDSNQGVRVRGASIIQSTGTGPDAANINITGTAGPGDDRNFGIIHTNSAAITSVDGNIILVGNGNGVTGTGHNNNNGIDINQTASIQCTGIGSISLTGTGGPSNKNSRGVRLRGSNGISTNSGDITIVGQGGNSNNASAVNGCHGILFQSTFSITSTSGDVSLSGTGGTNAGTGGETSTYGVFVQGNTINANSGNLIIQGQGSNNYGVYIDDAAARLGGIGATGDITITANATFLQGGTSGLLLQSSGALTLQPISSSATVGVGGAFSSTSFNISDTAIGNIVDGFSSITIGRTDGSHTTSINNNVFFADPLILRGDIINVPNPYTVTMSSNDDVTFYAGQIGAGQVNTGTSAFVSTSGTFTMDGGPNNTTFTILNPSQSVSLIDGNGGTGNTLQLADIEKTWTISDNNAGSLTKVAAFQNVQNLTGGSQPDTFVISDQKGISGLVDGGSNSGNTLDYSAYTTPIQVDLTAGTATNMGAITRIQDVILPVAVIDRERGSYTTEQILAMIYDRYRHIGNYSKLLYERENVLYPYERFYYFKVLELEKMNKRKRS